MKKIIQALKKPVSTKRVILLLVLEFIFILTPIVLWISKLSNLSVFIANWATVLSLFVVVCIFLYELSRYKQNARDEKISIINNFITELRLNQYNGLKLIKEKYLESKKEERFPVIVLKTEIIDDIFKILPISDIELVKLIMQVRDGLTTINRTIDILMNAFMQNERSIDKQHYLLDEMQKISTSLYTPTTMEDGVERMYAGGIIADLIKRLELLKKDINKEQEWYAWFFS